jgi:mono/diheme cytochrome c family protein
VAALDARAQAPTDKVDFTRDIQPIFETSCYACHGPKVQMAGLRLDAKQPALAGGQSGPVIVPAKSAESALYRRVAGIGEAARMPMGGKALEESQIARIRAWIDQGAAWPDAAGLAGTPAGAVEVKKHWAYIPPQRPALPKASHKKWPANAIDRFVLARLEKEGLSPSPEADRVTLLRRLSLDLIGLPPTMAEVDAFLKDKSKRAYEKQVDRLLQSPHYGERWGRHWLDLVRYADSAGFEFDRDRPNAWRYRDYVIRAFNRDLPYVQFIREQIAGDELEPRTGDGLIATGFLRHGPEANIKTEQTRMDELDDILATTGGVFLGMTLGCARCHNHKFDPIPQKDYYRMQAVFFPTQHASLPLEPDDHIARFQTANKAIDAQVAPVRKEQAALEKPYRDRLLAEKKSRLPEYIQLALRTPEDQRTEGQRLNAVQVEKTLKATGKDVLAAMSASDLARWRDLEARLESLNLQRPKPLATAFGIAEKGPEPEPSYFLHHGAPGNKGSVMQPGVLTVAARGEVRFPEAPKNAESSYRRRRFAEWIASSENPLTARVMVNRIWMHHFGEGIVATPNNFGKSGVKPAHPELLDWLAAEFVERGWSIKAMHRLMVTSAAYMAVRQPRRRLEGEIIRDGILSAAGTLDLKMGGPGVFPYIDPALWQSSSGRTWPGKPDSDPTTWRRSVYIFTKRTIPYPMLEMFDKPDPIGSCARRNRSTIAPQALILMNNAFVETQARFFAQRLQRDAGPDPAAQVDRAFQLTLARPPSGSERSAAVEFIRKSPYGLVDFCQTVFNMNEFVYAP